MWKSTIQIYWTLSPRPKGGSYKDCNIRPGLVTTDSLIAFFEKFSPYTVVHDSFQLFSNFPWLWACLMAKLINGKISLEHLRLWDLSDFFHQSYSSRCFCGIHTFLHQLWYTQSCSEVKVYISWKPYLSMHSLFMNALCYDHKKYSAKQILTRILQWFKLSRHIIL